MPGGTRIPTITAQLIVSMIDFNASPEQLVDAPRVHTEGPGPLLVSETIPPEASRSRSDRSQADVRPARARHTDDARRPREHDPHRRRWRTLGRFDHQRRFGRRHRLILRMRGSSGRSPACIRRALRRKVLWYGPTPPRGAGGGFRARFLLLAGPGVRPHFSGVVLKNKEL